MNRITVIDRQCFKEVCVYKNTSRKIRQGFIPADKLDNASVKMFSNTICAAEHTKSQFPLARETDV